MKVTPPPTVEHLRHFSRQNDTVLGAEEICRRLQVLAGVTPPLWLTGGVAVDFLVGRWTRRHGDLDLIAFHKDRSALEVELTAIGITLAQDGFWTTKWSFRGRRPADVEVVFVEDVLGDSAALVIPEDDPTGGTPGRYPFVDGYLRLDRWRELDGCRFRVSSAEGEWLNRVDSEGGGVVAGRAPDPKIGHDRMLLESLIPKERRLALLASRHQ